MGIETSPSYEPARPGDIRHSLAGIGRAKSIGYNPDYGLEDALTETIRSFGI
jgi:nucleoside-diphosphate-sugar epimerase